MKRTPRRGCKWLTTCALLLLGCGDSVTPSHNADPTPELTTDLADAGSPTTAQCAVKYTAPDRRLTRFELAYAVLDVFGLDASALHQLPAPLGGIGERPDIVVGSMLDVSPAFIEPYTQISEVLSAHIAQLWLGQCSYTECLLARLQHAAELLWRRPVNESERAAWHSALNGKAPPPGVNPAQQLASLTAAEHQALKFALHAQVHALLLSPEFYLLRLALVEPTALQAELRLASRLALLLWSSVPDRQLLDLAYAGQLSQTSVWRAQLKRMTQDARFQRFAHEFSRQWLALDRPALFRPDLEQADVVADPEHAAAVHADLSAWLHDHLHTPLPELLFAQAADGTRQGLLHSPALLSTLSTSISIGGNENWLGRGHLLQAAFLCRDWPLASVYPPHLWDSDPLLNAKNPLARPGEPKLLQWRTQEQVCRQCHLQLETLGAQLAEYDAWGNLNAAELQPASGSASNAAGPAQVKAWILGTGRFPGCVAQKLNSYALARAVLPDLRPEDRCATYGPELETEQVSLWSLLQRVVNSAEFLQPPEPTPTARVTQRPKPSPNVANYRERPQLPDLNAAQCAQFDAQEFVERTCGSSQCHAQGGLAAGWVGVNLEQTEELLRAAQPAANGFCSDYSGYLAAENPEQGLLLRKVLTPDEVCGAPMPLTGGAQRLSRDELSCFVRWAKELSVASSGQRQ